MYRQVFSLAAIALTFIAFFPYIRSILQGKTKPHVFSWVLWGTTTFIVFLAQLADEGGVGAWPIGVSGIITVYVALLAYLKKSDSSITRSDCAFFIIAMSAIPFWYLSNDPLWAVVILTSVDVIGFGPTIRKAYCYPFEEQLTFFVLMAMRNLFVIIALENLSVTTILFPALTGLVCMVFIVIVIFRRRALA